MNIGLIGLAKAGKTTIFNALTGAQAEVSTYTVQKNEPNVAVVDVLDARVDTLNGMYNPRKKIYATIQFTDFAMAGGDKGSLFSGEGVGLMKNSDALSVVLRNFREETIDGVYGEPDPVRDLESVIGELMLADQVVVEKRIERIGDELNRGKKTPLAEAELKTHRKILEALEEGRPVRAIDLNPDEKRSVSGFRFLTEKPIFVILNSGEESYGKNGELIESLNKSGGVIEFAGNFEMELSRLEQAEAAEFMADMGITESARARLTTFAYEILGYISFFTVGPDEVRAWTIRRGETAVDAAGTVHTDLARGFIRAECFTYNDLAAHGSEKAVREKGLFRLEGKEYPVQDGDILNIRFSV